MHTFLTILHVSVSIILIGVVLLQAGKGAEMGAAFGGSSQTIFGSRGSATFLSKLTVGAAIIFMITSMTLSVMSKDSSVVSSIGESSSSIPAPVETADEAADSADE